MAAPDKGTRWLIRNCTGSLLHRLRGRRVLRWEAPEPSLLHLERTPDGLLQALFEGETEPRPVLVEVTTYPKSDLARQCLEDICLARVALKQLPEVVVLVLSQRGLLVTPNRASETRADGTTSLTAAWTVLHAWEFTADALLQAQDPEEAPWAVLADYGTATPEEVVRRTRAVIERHPDATQQQKLLAATQALLRVRYNDPGLLELLGGRQVMLESPLIAELAEEWHGAELRQKVAEARAEARAEAQAEARAEAQAEARAATVETKAEAVSRVLRVRFQHVHTDVDEALRRERNLARLDQLMDTAVTCTDMVEFRARLWPS